MTKAKAFKQLLVAAAVTTVLVSCTGVGVSTGSTPTSGKAGKKLMEILSLVGNGPDQGKTLRKVTFTYDASDHLIKMYSETYTPSTAAVNFKMETTYTYNNKDENDESIEKESLPLVKHEKKVNSYDTEGNKIKAVVTLYGNDGQTVQCIRTYAYTYDKDKSVDTYVDVDNDMIADSYHPVTKKTVTECNSTTVGWSTAWTYDSHRKVTSQDDSDSGWGHTVTTYTNTYNADDQLTTQVSSSVDKFNDGRPDSNPIKATTTYTYDKNGNQTKAVTVNQNGGAQWVETTTYDSDGNVAVKQVGDGNIIFHDQHYTWK